MNSSRSFIRAVPFAFLAAAAWCGIRDAAAENCEPGDELTTLSGLVSSGVGPSDAAFESETGSVCVVKRTAAQEKEFPKTVRVYSPGSPQRRGYVNDQQLMPPGSEPARVPASAPSVSDLPSPAEDPSFTGQAGASCAQVHLPDRLSGLLQDRSENPASDPSSEDGEEGRSSLRPRVKPGDLKAFEGFRYPGIRRLLEQQAEEERKNEFVESVLEAQQAVQEAAAADDRGLRERYRGLEPGELASRLERSEQALDRQARILEQSTGGLPDSEKLRFANALQNARDKASAARGLLRRAESSAGRMEDTPDSLLPLANMFDPGHLGGARSTQISAALAALFGPASPTSADGLSNRVLLLNGLPDSDRKEAVSQLNLVEQPSLQLPDGTTATVVLPHNGYILGGGKTGMDCSSLVSSALPAEVSKGRFTTLDFHAMWIFRRYGNLPDPPKYPKARAELVTETALAFDALNLYRDDMPGPGDLLVYRTPEEPIGHVFVVKAYDPAKRTARVLEASQSAGTVRERDFPLTLQAAEQGKGAFTRPGLKLLRLRPVRQKVCRFERLGGKISGRRMPAGTVNSEEVDDGRNKQRESAPADDFCSGGRAC